MNTFFPLKILSIHNAIQNNQDVCLGAMVPIESIPNEDGVARYVLCLPQIHCAFQEMRQSPVRQIGYRFRLVVPKELQLLDHKQMAFEAYLNGKLDYHAALEDLPSVLALAVEVEILYMLSRKHGPVITQV